MHSRGLRGGQGRVIAWGVCIWVVLLPLMCAVAGRSLLRARLPVRSLPGALSCREGRVRPGCPAAGSGASRLRSFQMYALSGGNGTTAGFDKLVLP